MDRCDFFVGKGGTAEWIGSSMYMRLDNEELQKLLRIDDEVWWRGAVRHVLEHDGSSIIPPADVSSRVASTSQACTFDVDRAWITVGPTWFALQDHIDYQEHLDVWYAAEKVVAYKGLLPRLEDPRGEWGDFRPTFGRHYRTDGCYRHVFKAKIAK